MMCLEVVYEVSSDANRQDSSSGKYTVNNESFYSFHLLVASSLASDSNSKDFYNKINLDCINLSNNSKYKKIIKE